MARPCKLQVNQSGAWRDLLRFDLDEVDEHAVQHTAAALLGAIDPKGGATLRICMADSLQTALARWDAMCGWIEVRH